MDTNLLLESISNKLSALVALSLTATDKKGVIKENIGVLLRFGLSSQEIADILNTSKGTVDVIKSHFKKNNKK